MAADSGKAAEEIEDLTNEEHDDSKAPEEETGAAEAESVGPTPPHQAATLPCVTMDKLMTLAQLGVACLLLRCLFASLGAPSWMLLVAPSLWIAAAVIYMAKTAQKLDVVGKSVLITGCDTGFGHAMALHLDKMGFRVFAICLSDGRGADELRASGSESLHVINCDITNESQLDNARREVEEILPEGDGLWGLVNNAGLAAFGDLEWVPMSTYKRISDVNVLGLINVTRTFLPLIRLSKGRVVNMSCMVGRLGCPLVSPYAVTKYAVEGFSDCLRLELAQWGVSVVVVEPGNFISGTKILTPETADETAKKIWDDMSEDLKADYGEAVFQKRVKFIKDFAAQGNTDITLVTRTIASALVDKTPHSRYQPMNLGEKTSVWIATHLPEWVYDNVCVHNINK